MKRLPMRTVEAAAVLFVSATLACSSAQRSEPQAGGAQSTANAELAPLADSGVSGELTFMPTEGGVRVQGTVSGLAPSSTHGFHIHEVGDCSAPDGSSAGGHFNPTKHEHGAPSAASHVGDLGNITANADGVATVDAMAPRATLGEGETNILGRAVIVHADPDDLQTQPTGASGGRIACGVVR